MKDPVRRAMGGHRLGGPLLLLVAALAAACGGRGDGPESPRPDQRSALERPLEVYANVGLLTGSERFPAVAGFTTMAGPADSTFVLLGMSIPSRALRFERTEGGFAATYRVELVFERDGSEAHRLERQELVRVSSFAETARADESVVFQAMTKLPPAVYDVRLAVSDVRSGRGFDRETRVTVPAYGAAGKRTSAVMVYRAEARGSTESVPDLIMNPRHTLAFGAGSALLYLESYDGVNAGDVAVRVLDGSEQNLWNGIARFSRAGWIAHSLLEIPGDSLPMGRLWIELDAPGAGGDAVRAPLLVTMSDQWMVQNFDEVLTFLAYIAAPAEIDSLREARGRERLELWERFWERRNPTPAAPVNEFREEFFERVRTATEQLGEPGVPGWRSDRGRVYIVLGPPDQIIPRHINQRETSPPNAVDWLYLGVPSRLQLTFVDRFGFGRFELTRSSENAFRAAAERRRPRSNRR